MDDLLKERPSQYLNRLIYIFRLHMKIYMSAFPRMNVRYHTMMYICENLYRSSHKKNSRISILQDDLDPLFAMHHRMRTLIYFPRFKCDDTNMLSL